MAFDFWQRLFSLGVTYERDYQGDHHYMVEGNSPNIDKRTNLWYAQNHPILTPALLFVSNLLAQADFVARNKDTGEEVSNPYLELLKKPNRFQTRIDFLESLQFMKLAQGRAIVYIKRPLGFSDPEEMYVLRDDLISWPPGFHTPIGYDRNDDSLDNVKIIYDRDGLNLSIRLKDLLFMYDLPNMGLAISGRGANATVNLLEAPSRLDGLEQTLINTYDSLIAKNTILKTNGKEMLSSGGNSSGQAPFTADAKEAAQRMFNTGYGPGMGRSRAFITSADVNWQSLHVALRDLGLDESVKVDGNLIYTALHIPKDILSLEAKKTTYNNFKESMTSYIQNDIQAMANDIAETFWVETNDKNIVIEACFDHLPVMQFALMQKYESKTMQAQALQALRAAGLPDEMALDMVDLPTNTQLNELQIQQFGQETQTQRSSDQGTQEEEEED
jgi:hypothetical protein